MKEVKTPKKPLIFYYVIALIVLMLLNIFVTSQLLKPNISEVDYGAFISMTESSEIGYVQVQDNQIIFTDKENKNIYKTGVMNDPGLTERLYDSGAKFSQEIVQEASPLASFFFSWVLPILIFIGIGQLISRRIVGKLGGADSMMFGAGKSKAKIYVKSSTGIKFSDVAGEDEAKDSLREIVDYLHNPSKFTSIGASMPKGILLVARREQERPCLQRQ